MREPPKEAKTELRDVGLCQRARFYKHDALFHYIQQFEHVRKIYADVQAQFHLWRMLYHKRELVIELKSLRAYRWSYTFFQGCVPYGEMIYDSHQWSYFASPVGPITFLQRASRSLFIVHPLGASQYICGTRTGILCGYRGQPVVL